MSAQQQGTSECIRVDLCNEYYAVMKNNEDALCALIWNNFQDVLLSRKLKRQNSGYDVLLFVFLKTYT